MTKHNIWSISIIVLLFAALLTPLIVAGSLYFPFVTGKVFMIRIIVSLATALWLVLILKKPEFLPKKSSVLITSAAFVAWLAFANIFSVDSSNSFFSNFERMEGWFTHLYLFLFLLVASSVLQTEKLWNWFLATSVIVANYIALYATFDSTARTQAILGNSTYVAIYALFNLFFAVLLAYRIYKSTLDNIALKYTGILYYVLSVILFVYVIFRTQTRGTVLALVFSTILFLILSAISYWKNKKVRIVTLTLVILSILVAGLFWQNRNAAFIQNNPMLVRVATISASEGTGKARLVNWNIAINGIKENPLLGWGQENYTYVFAQKYDPRMYAQEPWFDRTHNAFLDWSIQGGIPALLIYLALFATAAYTFKVSTSLTRTEKNLMISLLAAYGIHNMFVFDNYSSYLMFFVVLAFAIHHSQKEKIKIILDEKMKQAAVIFLVLLLILASYFTVIKPLSASRELITVFSQKDAYKVLDIYKSILEKNSFGSDETTIRLLSEANNFMKVDNAEFQKAYLDFSTKAGEEMIVRGPDDVRRLETYGTYLYQVGDISKSISILEKAQTLAPNRHNNLYTLGFAYIENKQLDKAMEVFKHAYEQLPENETARTYYGAVLLLSGDTKGKDFIGNYSYKNPIFLLAFGKTKQYKEVIKIREQFKSDNPTDYQNQVSLAVAYVLDKQPAKAIQILREVQKAVPEFKAQGDALIRDIQTGKSIVK